MVRAQHKNKASSKTKGGAKQQVDAGVAKKRKWKAGTVALRTIKKFQKSTVSLLLHMTFERWVRAMAQDLAGDVRFKKGVIRRLQHYAENEMVKLARHANLVALHAKRQTLRDVDIKIVNIIQEAT